MDYLYGTSFQIRQEKEMYHFSSDSELLGRFLVPKKEDSVLDVGVNSGVLLLYASLAQPKCLTGIDLFEEVIELARENLDACHVSASLHACPLQEFKGGPFTLVVCNPPFFTSTREDLKSRNPYRRAARFTDTLKPAELFFHARRLLTDDGRLDVIYPYPMMEEIFREAENSGFHLIRLQMAYDTRGGTPKRALMEFSCTERDSLAVLPAAYLDKLHSEQKPADARLDPDEKNASGDIVGRMRSSGEIA